MFDEMITAHHLVDRDGAVIGIVGDGLFDTLMRRDRQLAEAVGAAMCRALRAGQRGPRRDW